MSEARERIATMKYMLLMQFNAQVDFPAITAWTPEEIKAHQGFMQDLNH